MTDFSRLFLFSPEGSGSIHRAESKAACTEKRRGLRTSHTETAPRTGWWRAWPVLCPIQTPGRRKNTKSAERTSPPASQEWLQDEEKRINKYWWQHFSIDLAGFMVTRVQTWIKRSTECIDAHAPAAHTDACVVALVRLRIVGGLRIATKYHFTHEVGVEEQHPLEW